MSQENKCRRVGLGRRTSKANDRKIAAAGYGKMELPSTGQKAAPTIERLVRPDLPICFGAQTLMPNCVIRSVPFFASSC